MSKVLHKIAEDTSANISAGAPYASQYYRQFVAATDTNSLSWVDNAGALREIIFNGGNQSAVTIGTNTANSLSFETTDTVRVTIGASGLFTLATGSVIPVQTIAGNVNVTLGNDAHYIRVNATGAQNYTLPTATVGRVIKFKRIDSTANVVTLTGVIDGETNPTSSGGGVASALSTQYGQLTLIGNGTNWDLA